MSAADILVTENLTRHFGGGRNLFKRDPLVRAVDGVSLAIRRGETFAIVGESGCGKSTLARLILRLIQPTAGRVIFDGEDITYVSATRLRSLRREMQVVFQDPYTSLNPRMTVGDLVSEPIRTHGLATGADVERETARTLDLVGLARSHSSRYPHEFSGGQRQRIGIARALASRPKLLIGDEPVSALDVSIRAQIINLLEDLKAELNLTLILVSHDLGVVRHTADRVAVMYLGEVIETAPAASLFRTPRHPYTQALMAAAPEPDPTLRRDRPLLEGDPPSPANPPSGCRFHTRCPNAIARCGTEAPMKQAAGSDHNVACHRADEITPPGTKLAAGNSAIRDKRIELFAAAAAGRQPRNGSPP